MKKLILMMAVLLVAGGAAAQDFVDDLNLPTGIYWEFLGYATATADTFWTVEPTLTAGTASAATGFYDKKDVVHRLNSDGDIIKITKRVRFLVLVGKGDWQVQVYQNGQAAPAAGATGVGYAWIDSNLWDASLAIVGNGTQGNSYPSAFAVEWPDTLHVASAATDSVKVYAGY